MEHHSNLLPWMQAAEDRRKLVLYVECDENGHISGEAFRSQITPRTRIVAMTQISNVLGVCNDVKNFADCA
jgi:cysteine desulfurase/selenocysteine lyase